MKRFMQLSIGVLCLLIAALIGFHLGSRTAVAEPDSVVKHLMDDPVSMLDWGNLALERALEERLSFAFAPVNVVASYVWASNRIEIHIIVPQNETATTEEAHKLGSALFGAAREDLRLGTVEGSYAILGGLYSHAGFQRGDEPSDIGRRLANIVELHFMTYTRDDGWVYGEGELATDDMLWGETASEKPKRKE